MKALIIVGCLLLALGTGVWRVIKPPVPTDKDVIRVFEKNRSTLQEVVAFCAKHPGLTRIAQNSTYPEDYAPAHVSPDELREIRRKLTAAGFPEGVAITFGGYGPKFLFMTGGLVTGGVSKGVLYSASAPRPLKPSLDDMGWKTYSHHSGYRHIDGPWYVFFDRS
jgi:hypothetical protein